MHPAGQLHRDEAALSEAGHHPVQGRIGGECSQAEIVGGPCIGTQQQTQRTVHRALRLLDRVRQLCWHAILIQPLDRRGCSVQRLQHAPSIDHQ